MANEDNSNYKNEIEKKIIELQNIKRETIEETKRLKEENEKISKNIENQEKIKRDLLELIKKNNLYNTEKHFIINNKINKLDKNYYNISSIELNGYNFFNIINNIDDNNNELKFKDHLNNIYNFKIKNGYYTKKNICKELNNNQYYESFGLKFSLDNNTNKMIIKSTNNITLLWSPLLDLLGYENNDELVNKNNLIGNYIFNRKDDKIIYVYILELNDREPIFHIMLNSNKINNQIVNFYPIINNINNLTFEFRNSFNNIITINDFSLNIILKYDNNNNNNNNNNKELIDNNKQLIDNNKELIDNDKKEINLYEKLMMSYC